MFHDTNDARSTWVNINKLIKRSTGIDHKYTLETDNGVFTRKKLVANEFNRYFTGIGEELSSNTGTTQVTTMQFLSPIPNSFVCIDTDVHEVASTNKGMKNKSTTLKPVPNFIYKAVADILALLLVIL